MGARPQLIRRVVRWLRLSVHVPTMAELDDGDCHFGVIDGIEDAVVTLSEAELLLAGQLLATSWTWLRGQSLNAARHATPVLERECFEFLGRRPFYEDAIACHGASDL